MDPRRIVAEGYDRVADRYAQWAYHEVVDEARPRYVALVLDSLPEGASVLELGCGGGGPSTRQLAARFSLTGVDISARQVELARQSAPGATFIHADMSRVEFPSSSFDGVVAFYAPPSEAHERARRDRLSVLLAQGRAEGLPLVGFWVDCLPRALVSPRRSGLVL
jgi:SAM-dependent methyltransferase